MANILNANTFYINANSAAGTEGSYLSQKDIQVVGILYTGDTAGVVIKLCDLNQLSAEATPSAGDLKLSVTTDVVRKENYIDLSSNPIRFPNGIWATSVQANSETTLIVKLKS